MQRDQITGLILSGGRGSRWGGVDKGLQPYRGRPLVAHALDRLKPQVGRLMISANRHLNVYKQWGVPVWSDFHTGYEGPLAGLMVGLHECETPYLQTVPCDCPLWPVDLVSRLAHRLQAERTDLALAATRNRQGEIQLEPVFCLMRCELLGSLQAFMGAGQRKIEQWTALHARTIVVFDDAAAFINLNSLADMAKLLNTSGVDSSKH